MITIMHEKNENIISKKHDQRKYNGRLYKTRTTSSENKQEKQTIRPTILSKQPNLLLRKTDESVCNEQVLLKEDSRSDETKLASIYLNKNLKESNSSLASSSQTVLTQQNTNLPQNQTAEKQQFHTQSVPSLAQKLAIAPQLTNSIKIIDDNFTWNDQFQDYLLEQNDYLVVGVLGKQGVGKSTLMSLLAGNKFTDETKNMIFKHGSKIQHHQQQQQADKTTTTSNSALSGFVTTERTILLDAQPLLSSTILDKAIRYEKKHSSHDFKYYENLIELQSIELACFLMNICNVLIICEDWFTDMNLYKLLQTAEMLMPNQQDDFNMTTASAENYPHLIFVQNKCDYISKHDLSNMSKCIDSFMCDSKVHYKGSIKDIKGKLNTENVNLVTIPKYEKNSSSFKKFSGMASFEKSINHLRREILAVKRNNLSTNPIFNEKKWFLNASKTWETIKKSSMISEYNRLMT